MRRAVVVIGTTAIAVAAIAWALSAFGARSVWFAFVVVWLPMAWLGTVGRFVRPRLPARYHRLRRFERDGRIYRLLGVRAVKRLLRRGPLAVFNPHLHLPAEPNRANVKSLDQQMRDAEASHAILLVATVAVVVHAAVRGWWVAAVSTLAFDVLMNGYPVMLQRYNRALLAQRFERRPPSDQASSTSSRNVSIVLTALPPTGLTDSTVTPASLYAPMRSRR